MSPLELRRIQDELVGPALASLPGVAEVAPLGGSVQQLSVEASPDLLRTHGIAFSDLVSTVRAISAAHPQPPRSLPPPGKAPPSLDSPQGTALFAPRPARNGEPAPAPRKPASRRNATPAKHQTPGRPKREAAPRQPAGPPAQTPAGPQPPHQPAGEALGTGAPDETGCGAPTGG